MRSFKPITDFFPAVDCVVSEGNTFFYGPATGPSLDRRFTFATLVTYDTYDRHSDLDRPSAFRLNIGISKETFHALFGSRMPPRGADVASSAAEVFTAFDLIMPHPVYGRIYWACVLNPSAATFQEAAWPLLVEAYHLATIKSAKRHARN